MTVYANVCAKSVILSIHENTEAPMFKRLRERWHLATITPYAVIMRHANTASADGETTPERGRTEALQAAAEILSHYEGKGRSFVVYTSSLIQAQHTGAIVAKELGTTAKPVPWLVKGPASHGQTVWRELRSLPRECVPVLVTHKDQVEQLTSGSGYYHAHPFFVEREP